MALPAVVWGGVWAAGLIGARIAARQIIKRVMQAAARQALSRAAQQAYSTAVAAGTLAPTNYGDIDGSYAQADDRANALSRAMAAQCAADPQKCQACDATRGSPVPRSWNMSQRARQYQKFITGFPMNVEYNYNGVDFDGFWLLLCTLVEAKDKYDNFLSVSTTNGGIFSSAGITGVEFREWWQGKDALVAEARAQKAAAVPTPPVMLQWHCAQIAFTIAITAEFNQSGIAIVPIYTPNPYHPDPHGQFIVD